jgi:serine protease Do
VVFDTAENGITGARILRLTANTPAARAGLAPGDIIVAVNGEPVMNKNDFDRLQAGVGPGSAIVLKVFNDSGTHDVRVVLGTR